MIFCAWARGNYLGVWVLQHNNQYYHIIPGNKLDNNNDEHHQKQTLNSSGILFGNGSLTGPPNTSNTTHGTSAGFCNICQKFVSNRTNHKYVHSQVYFIHSLKSGN